MEKNGSQGAGDKIDGMEEDKKKINKGAHGKSFVDVSSSVKKQLNWDINNSLVRRYINVP